MMKFTFVSLFIRVVSFVNGLLCGMLSDICNQCHDYDNDIDFGFSEGYKYGEKI